MGKRIRVRYGNDDPYRHDCERIQRVLADRGYDASLEQCKEIWERFSDSMAAGWMGLPEDDADLFYDAKPYFEEEPTYLCDDDEWDFDSEDDL